MAEPRGIVYLVGAGPGDPGLLTRRGEALLRRAEVVVFDRLAAPALLELAPPTAERVYVGKQPGRHALPQAAINDLLVARGRAGRVVVRLKGGDPFVFGRGGEEALALRAAGVTYEVVPGVTSAVAAPAYAGIPVTHRGLASSVTIATGHEDPTRPASSLDWSSLARGADTLVLLMGVEHVAEIASQLMRAGRRADEPAALVRWGTTAEQETLLATLGTIAAQSAERGLQPPAVLVIGAVAGLADQLAWFERRPLSGRRVLVTRAREQASGLSERLAELGAEPVEFPAIRIRPLEDPASLDRALGQLRAFDWVVFTSANGVRAAFERLDLLGLDARAFSAARVAAIGPATAEALRERGLRADFVPSAFTSQAMLAELAPRIGSERRVLLLQADVAPRALADGLAASGAVVENVVAYRTEPDASGRDEVQQRLEAGSIDFVTFTSSSTVRNLVAALGGSVGPLAGPTIACIGPVTAATARELGLRVDLVAAVHTIDGLIEALVAGAAPTLAEEAVR